MRQELLPLFPLPLVLLPGARLPLHIFEERYKEMIGDAIRRQSEFGIVLGSEKGIANVGCTAIVDHVQKTHEDGRMDIVAAGRRRFEILSLNDEKPYLRGAVEFFDDEDDREPESEARAKVEQAFEELKHLEAEQETESIAADAPLSFRVTQVLTDLNLRQVILTSRSEVERIEKLAEHLPAALEKMRSAEWGRARAPRNGRARHIEF